jgi:hypothetical protein
MPLIGTKERVCWLSSVPYYLINNLGLLILQLFSPSFSSFDLTALSCPIYFKLVGHLAF